MSPVKVKHPYGVIPDHDEGSSLQLARDRALRVRIVRAHHPLVCAHCGVIRAGRPGPLTNAAIEARPSKDGPSVGPAYPHEAAQQAVDMATQQLDRVYYALTSEPLAPSRWRSAAALPAYTCASGCLSCSA